MDSQKVEKKIHKFGYILLCLLLTYFSFCILDGLYRLVFFTPTASGSLTVSIVLAALALLFGVALTLVICLTRQRLFIKVMTEVILIVILPLWGLAINQSLPHCDGCSSANRGLHSPDLVSLFVIYFASAIAYLIARRRPERLRPLAEMLVAAFLMAGIVICLALSIHVGLVFIMGLLVGPVGLPLIAPATVAVLFSWVLIRRLVRRGKEEDNEHWISSWPAIVGLGLLPLLGAWSILQKLIFDLWPHHMFTQTCDWGLSQLQPPPGDCHYLCTVAARGHGWLVKPLRRGHRHGHEIIVNRQLALANAFEDLLHARWPRFGRFCRRLYDRLGLPLSRVLGNIWLADLVYLLMKPFECLFYLCLLLLDPEDPERRIGSMYRDRG